MCLTWLTYTDTHGSAGLGRGFFVEVNDVTGSLVVTAAREPVEVRVLNLRKGNTMALSNLGALSFCDTLAVTFVHIIVGHCNRSKLL